MLITHSQEVAAQLLGDPPRLHTWAGEWHVGSFSGDAAQLFLDVLEPFVPTSARGIETGAGLSTLLGLAAVPARWVTIERDAELRQRVRRQADGRRIDITPLEMVAERAEVHLPRLVERGDVFDVALLNSGAHLWPTVFVELCYLTALLPRGGTLILDAIQVHSVKVLVDWLGQQPQYREVGRAGVTVAFAKETDLPFMSGSWEDQPYIRSATAADRGEGR